MSRRGTIKSKVLGHSLEKRRSMPASLLREQVRKQHFFNYRCFRSFYSWFRAEGRGRRPNRIYEYGRLISEFERKCQRGLRWLSTPSPQVISSLSLGACRYSHSAGGYSTYVGSYSTGAGGHFKEPVVTLAAYYESRIIPVTTVSWCMLHN